MKITSRFIALLMVFILLFTIANAEESVIDSVSAYEDESIYEVVFEESIDGSLAEIDNTDKTEVIEEEWVDLDEIDQEEEYSKDVSLDVPLYSAGILAPVQENDEESATNSTTYSDNIDLFPYSLELGLKETYTLNAGHKLEGKITYTSSNRKVATIGKTSGKIKANRRGTTFVTAKANGEKVTCAVTVRKAPSKIKLSSKSIKLSIGERILISPTLPKNSASHITWKSSKPSIAKVDRDGRITAVAVGKATITAKTYNGKKAKVTVAVSDLVQGESGYMMVEALSWENFAIEAAKLVRNYGDYLSIEEVGGEYESGRLIVSANGSLPSLVGYDAKAVIHDPENHYLIQFSSSSEAERCAAYLRNSSTVTYVEADQNIEGSDMKTQDVNIKSLSWGVAMTYSDAYAADLKSRNKTGSIIVAVVDTGVDTGQKMLKGRSVSGYDYVDGDKKPQDGNSHGTHVAGTIVDCTPNLNVKIMPVRVLNNQGRGSTAVVAQGIRYAVGHGAKVINLSLGGSHSQYMDEAVSYALKKNVVVVVAAGNDNSNTNGACPAHITGCITVAAVDSTKSRAYFSNYGNALDIAAPGVEIKSAVPGNDYDLMSGTSMAAPHVSAAAAMLLCEESGLSPSSVERKLRDAATDLGSSGWDAYYGAGFLNLAPFIKGGPQKYTVTYNGNGGNGVPASQTKLEDVNLTLSTTRPSKTNTITFDYSTGNVTTRQVSEQFMNWNTRSNGTGTSFEAGGIYTDNASVTLYAQWINGRIGTLPSASRIGYNFVGWYTAPNGGTVVNSDTIVTADMTLYAHWSGREWSEWVEKSAVPSDATEIESKTQYRYRDSGYSDWSGWSAWSENREATSDLKKEESTTLYYWYRFVCPHCGAHMHVWDKCHTWAGGCGNRIGSENAQVTWLALAPSGGVQNWEGTGRIMTGNGPRDRWFYWTDASQGYPNGKNTTGYRYATRSLIWSNWSSWSDTAAWGSNTRQVETRELYRYKR